MWLCDAEVRKLDQNTGTSVVVAYGVCSPEAAADCMGLRLVRYPIGRLYCRRSVAARGEQDFRLARGDAPAVHPFGQLRDIRGRSLFDAA